MLVRVADEPGAIAHLAKRLRDSDLHIRSMRVVQHHGDWGAIAVSADPIEKARDLVKDELFSIPLRFSHPNPGRAASGQVG